jgi:hypothetical protein
VQDGESKKMLTGATMMLLKNQKNTRSDASGNFYFLIQATALPDTLLVSFLGYETARRYLNTDTPNLPPVLLLRKPQSLPLVIIYGISAKKLLEEAILRIPSNYDSSVTWLTGKYKGFEKEDTTVTRKLEAMIQIKRQPFSKKASMRPPKSRRRISSNPEKAILKQLLI